MTWTMRKQKKKKQRKKGYTTEKEEEGDHKITKSISKKPNLEFFGGTNNLVKRSL